MSINNPGYHNGEKIPTQFASSIIIKAFEGNDKGFIEFINSYRAARSSKYQGRVMTEPSAIQYRAAILRKEGMEVAVIGKKLGMKKAEVYNAISRVATWAYLKS